MARYPQGETEKRFVACTPPGAKLSLRMADVPVMDYVASLLDLDPIEVYEVAGFTVCITRNRLGNMCFEVCQTGPCMINGRTIS